MGSVNILTSNLVEQKEQHKDKKFRFDIQTPNSTPLTKFLRTSLTWLLGTYKIIAENPTEVKEWIEAINNAKLVSINNKK